MIIRLVNLLWWLGAFFTLGVMYQNMPAGSIQKKGVFVTISSCLLVTVMCVVAWPFFLGIRWSEK